jgi:hypothetical protein
VTTRAYVPVSEGAARSDAAVLADLGSAVTGLTDDAQVERRRVRVGRNAVRTHQASAVAVLVRQLRSALLLLLAAAAVVSFFAGERTDAVVIAVILAVSVGLGFATSTAPSGSGRRCTTRCGIPRSWSPPEPPAASTGWTWFPVTWCAWIWAWWCPPTSGCWRRSTWSVTGRC